MREINKALVTGAAGFIGSHVVRQLLDENVKVRALIRPGESLANLQELGRFIPERPKGARGPELGEAGIELMEGDILDQRAVDRAMEGADTLFHLAAIYAFWTEDYSSIYEVNLQGSRNVLWSAMRHGVQRVVYTSSIAGVGVAPGRELSDEQTPFNQHTLGNHYVLSKHLSQQEALGFAENGLDLVVVNPALPFGERDLAPTPTGQIIVDILRGISRFRFAGGFNIVDVRDVARGHVLAARKGRTGELYILGNANVTMDRFVQLICEAADLDSRFWIPLPVPVAKVAAVGLTWWADHVSHRPPITTPVEVAYTSNYLFYDTTKARRELGLELTPVQHSLDRAVRWFREHGYA